MKPVLTIDKLIESARRFCEIESKENHVELIGVTDGKAVGTYVEHKFQHFLQSRYIVDVGSSAKGIDLPGADIQTLKLHLLHNHNQVVHLRMPVRKFSV